ncbi:MAG: hypothetical protein QOE55_2497 [Acidobacteriaceae bacterium]|nr:hypothetical protein [Acidobacteriaceae bacterium]
MLILSRSCCIDLRTARCLRAYWTVFNDRFAPIPVTHELISVFVKSYQGTTDSISCVTREPTTFCLGFFIFFWNLFFKLGRASRS